ncbi:MAG: phosphatidic acid phosphatase [Oscillospiraceae bacterium]|nr:phosphatidic acid phosphatase [Oscillospiraceae bacterium]
MRRTAVDYRGFRLKKINESEFKHLKLLLGWVVYFALYALTERLIPAERCFVVHCRLDDRIPFCEWFVIPYVAWYGLIVFSLVWFLRYDVELFTGLQTYFIITQVVATLIYILLPTRQELRPELFPRENVLTDLVAALYRADTSTNVCPSLHVALSLGIASAWLREKTVRWIWRGSIVLLAVLICLSTVFIKQHSAVDFLAALPVCALAEWFVFYKRKRK